MTMASDEHVATALRELAKALLEGSRNSASAAHGDSLPEEPDGDRRKRLKSLSEQVQAMANNPRAATYLGFEGAWKQARELGAEVPSEITIAVASAFMQRPHVRSRIK